MDFNFQDENKPYSSDDAYEDLEKIRDILHDAQMRINKDKINKANIDVSINIDLPDSNK
ncbi:MULTISPECIES: hypothetical protein [Pseudobutyrivibrio]|uniref:hypothetical protein n=1 Tax=Pseudobutyrivibrio TaxID=46205 RepID=UPI0008908344|nr:MULTISPECIES: hypothetical protein [Pseudobutyrivibrio]MBR5953352.1 hypothetical protein [Pseudobutyrivibrio sp.]SCY10417.1 hypothetical protein SAMN05660668_01443 [Pseudobutyrivibrio sp. AR14]SFR73417.1 hypothetical protein SAMN04487829_1605 [Pseudobutyrivibrio sp. NOR37]